jgi:hypothetical protein
MPPRDKNQRSLQLSRIIAEGQPAEFRTIKDGQDQVYAAMGKMVYHLNDHRLELMDRSVAADGSRIPLEVHQNGTKLTTAYSVVTMTEDNEVQAIQCRGEGRIGPSTRIPGEGDQSEKPVFGAAWKESLVMLRGEEPRITLTGAAKVVQASRQPRESCQWICLWVAIGLTCYWTRLLRNRRRPSLMIDLT